MSISHSPQALTAPTHTVPSTPSYCTCSTTQATPNTPLICTPTTTSSQQAQTRSNTPTTTSTTSSCHYLHKCMVSNRDTSTSMSTSPSSNAPTSTMTMTSSRSTTNQVQPAIVQGPPSSLVVMHTSTCNRHPNPAYLDTNTWHIDDPHYYASIAQGPSTSSISHMEETSATLNTYTQAMSSPDACHWLKAMNEEYQSLQHNSTYQLVSSLPGHNIVHTHWLYKVKTRADGSIEHYKACWVAKGFSQIHNINYNETFAPVICLKNLHLLLALTTALNLEIHQMDVDTAFLHAHLTEEIYITQPKGFVSHNHPNYVCHLLKSLCSLKQAPYMWNQTINSYLITYSFLPTEADPCIYILCRNNNMSIISLYIDDYTILASQPLVNFTKQVFNNKFKMKDLGEASSILGIEIICNHAQGILKLHQTGHINMILHQFNMANCKPKHMPIESGLHLPKLDSTPPEALNIPYRQAIGKLLYLSQASCPDISYTVNLLSHHVNAYSDIYWTAVKHVLRYLQATCHTTICYDRSLVLLLHPSMLLPTTHYNADWGGNLDDRRSVISYMFYLCSGLFAWSSKAQSAVALLSCKVKLNALSKTVKQALYLCKLFTLLHLCLNYPIRIHSNNQSALKLANNKTQVYLAWMKHYNIKLHHMCDCIKEKKITLHYCPTKNMITDMLTKPLPCVKLNHLKQLTNICNHDSDDNCDHLSQRSVLE